MSDITGAARWSEPSADRARRRNVWLAGLIALTALLVVGNLASDAALDLEFGWDVRVNCAAVEAHLERLDPYYVTNLKGTDLSYPYLPATLDAFRPLCAGGFLVRHYRGVFLALAMFCALLLPGLGRAGRGDIALRSLWVFGAFVGFEWVLASGNFAIMSGALSAAALALLLRSTSPDHRGRAARIAGAALLGLVASFKLVYSPVLAALYFLPLPRREKVGLIAAAAAGLALPILLSVTLYPDLFSSWLLAIGGRIPEQHSIYAMDTTPSLLLLAQQGLDHVGLGGSKPVVLAAYAVAALVLVLAPFALALLRIVADGQVRAEGSLPARLDRWLIDHPRIALRLTVLAMYGLYLCAPRLKEYAFFELALYGAILIADLPAAAIAAVLTIGIAVPAVVSHWGSIEGSFVQLACALVCFWIILQAQSMAPERVVRAAGVEPAQRLRTEGF